MITLSQLYRDINTFFGEKGVNDQEIYHLDTTNVINQLIASLRVEFIQNGLGDEFTIAQTISNFTEDAEFPFVYSSTLTKPILRTLPLAWSVKQTLFPKTPNVLTTTIGSWNKGDIVRKGNYVYVATENVPAINSFALTFSPNNIRAWKTGLNYTIGDIVYDGGSFYKATSSHTKTEGELITDAPFTKVYWRLLGDAYHQATPVPFKRLYEGKLNRKLYEHYPFSIKDDRIYTVVDAQGLVLIYIPEWEYVEDLDVTLDIPDSMVAPLKERAIATLAQKLGITAGG